MKIVVLDIETQKSFNEVKNNNPKLLKVSFAGILQKFNEKEEYLGFEEKEIAKLWPILEQAELIVGFNLKSFDFPVLSYYYPGDFSLFPALDILEVFEKKTGHRISLNQLAKATLNIQKIGTGLAALDLFKQGKMSELKKYCLHDVKLTHDLYDYARKFGHLKYFDHWNNLRKIEVDFRTIDKQAKVQMTLGG